VLTNLLSMLLMPLIGAALTNCFGRMVGDERQGWALLSAMLLLLAGAVALHVAEACGNPLLTGTGVDQRAGNLEAKELRFGVIDSALFSEIGTATSSGAVNAMHDSYLTSSRPTIKRWLYSAVLLT
jgi:K+-transporting ATPase ATPase A chain